MEVKGPPGEAKLIPFVEAFMQGRRRRGWDPLPGDTRCEQGCVVESCHMLVTYSIFADTNEAHSILTRIGELRADLSALEKDMLWEFVCYALCKRKQLQGLFTRPNVPVAQNPKAWWSHCIECVASDLVRERHYLPLSQLRRFRRFRTEYSTLFRRLLRHGSLSPSQADRLAMLERGLPLDVIYALRERTPRWQVEPERQQSNTAAAAQYEEYCEEYHYVYGLLLQHGSLDTEHSIRLKQLGRILGLRRRPPWDLPPDADSVYALAADQPSRVECKAFKILLRDAKDPKCHFFEACVTELACTFRWKRCDACLPSTAQEFRLTVRGLRASCQNRAHRMEPVMDASPDTDLALLAFEPYVDHRFDFSLQPLHVALSLQQIASLMNFAEPVWTRAVLPGSVLAGYLSHDKLVVTDELAWLAAHHPRLNTRIRLHGTVLSLYADREGACGVALFRLS